MISPVNNVTYYIQNNKHTDELTKLESKIITLKEEIKAHPFDTYLRDELDQLTKIYLALKSGNPEKVYQALVGEGG